MALQIKTVDVWAGEMQDQSGALARVLEALAAGGADVDCVIGRRQPDRPGSGVVFVSPVSGKRAQTAARAAGISPANDIGTLRVEGANKQGLGGRITRAIADAGLNLRGVSAATIGNKFVAYFGFDSAADAARAAAVLKSFDKAGGKKAKRAR